MTTAQGLLGTSGTGGPTLATGVFDHVSLRGARSPARWTGDQLGGGPSDAYPARAAGTARPAARSR